jgi:putative CocE/NonD family hydrolase
MGTGDGHKTGDGRLFHGGYWREENNWPLDRAIDTKYYLHENGSLSKQPPPGKKSMTSYESDPEDPVPSIGGNSCCSWGEYGPYNQWGGSHITTWEKPIPISARNDVIVFQSEPLSRDMEVTGEIKIKLWASSDALDTDFTGKLIDVYPPNKDFSQGFDMNIVDGITRARFRYSLKEEHLMEPGRIYEFTIQLGPVSNVFKKGHRIRVDISSSNYPRFEVNPNTGEPLNDHRQKKIAVNTIYHDKTHSSHIILPVVN